MADPLQPHDDGREIAWFNPPQRAILPLTPQDGLHTPRTIARIIRQQRFRITSDHAFARVLHACAQPRDDDDLPWLNRRMIDMYQRLHHAGHAHSIEAWARDPDTRETALAGGLYGLSIGAAFFAESMFHRPRPRRPDGSRHPLDGTNASSVALVSLAHHLHTLGYHLLDIQIINDHTARFGAREITRQDFLRKLRNATQQTDRWRPHTHSPHHPQPSPPAPDAP